MKHFKGRLPEHLVWVSVLAAIAIDFTSLLIAGKALFMAITIGTAEFNGIIRCFLAASAVVTMGLIGLLKPSRVADVIRAVFSATGKAK